uniref:ATP-dependent RNA helicase Ski2/MTR4 C-terminal domain-containing protein n=1 Tax=Phaeomonas parva TaxID=124430 RepID=A0A7S1UDM2_9STRA|mmetsp:Transcript_40131/g.125649  ORF Transcript_40131/g.125649 Transcript_40131/m.125649 type:complete len:544 (+) Transcript_40131:2-1633(+)
MSGRAGRRGLDSRGTVIQMLDEKMEPAVCKNMIYGESEPLNSSFHISYNMLLNMMRVEGADPEFLMRSSFHQYQQELALPSLQERADAIKADVDGLEVENEADVAAYAALSADLRRVDHEANAVIMREEHAKRFLQCGRIARVVCPDPDVEHGAIDYGLGIIVNHRSVRADGRQGRIKRGVETRIEVDVLIEYAATTAGDDGKTLHAGMRPFVPGSGDLAVRKVVTVKLENLRELTAVMINSAAKKDLNRKEPRDSLMRTVAEARRRNPEGLPLLKPREDMEVPEAEISPLLQQQVELRERLNNLSVKDMEEEAKARAFANFELKQKMQLQLRAVKREINSAQSLVMQDDLKRMRKVLRRLGHADNDDVIQLKGRVACEINSADELVATELMFNGVFASLTEEQLAGLVACLCFAEKRTEEDARLSPTLAGPFQQLQEAARQVGTVCADCGVELEVEAFVEKFNPEMMEVLYAWASGCKFVDLCKLTDAYEGTIIRLIRREEELLRQLSSASYAIGNMELRDKFDRVSTKIKRDIVFAASLYL